MCSAGSHTASSSFPFACVNSPVFSLCREKSLGDELCQHQCERQSLLASKQTLQWEPEACLQTLIKGSKFCVNIGNSKKGKGRGDFTYDFACAYFLNAWFLLKAQWSVNGGGEAALFAGKLHFTSTQISHVCYHWATVLENLLWVVPVIKGWEESQD